MSATLMVSVVPSMTGHRAFIDFIAVSLGSLRDKSAIKRQEGELLVLGTIGVGKNWIADRLGFSGYWSEPLLESERDTCAARLAVFPVTRDLRRDRALRIQFERQTGRNLRRFIVFAVIEGIAKSIRNGIPGDVLIDREIQRGAHKIIGKGNAGIFAPMFSDARRSGQ